MCIRDRDKRGGATTFNVTNLPDSGAVRITVNGQPFTRFEVTGANSIRVDTTIDERQFRIATGYRGPGGQPAARREPSPGTRAAAATAPAVPAAAGAANAAQPTTSEIAQGGGAVCPCCA